MTRARSLARPPAFLGAFDVVALAASAGGLGALSHVVSALPVGFQAAVLALLHLDPRHVSLLARVLGRRTQLAVKEAEDGDRVAPGVVYTAAPDRHLLLQVDGRLALSRTEPVHFVRPSADVLFESLAAAYGERGIAVVLTGTGRDGAHGLEAVKRAGGVVLVQDEATSEFFGMPGAAISTGAVDMVLPLDAIPAALTALVAGLGVPRR